MVFCEGRHKITWGKEMYERKQGRLAKKKRKKEKEKLLSPKPPPPPSVEGGGGGGRAAAFSSFFLPSSSRSIFPVVRGNLVSPSTDPQTVKLRGEKEKPIFQCACATRIFLSVSAAEERGRKSEKKVVHGSKKEKKGWPRVPHTRRGVPFQFFSCVVPNSL